MSVIAVTGGRDFADWALVDRVLSALHKKQRITDLLVGDARGADSIAAAWARDHGVDVHCFVANWRDEGNAAGPIRNGRILACAKARGARGLVAFKGNRGTADCCAQARALGILVWETWRVR